MNLGLLWLLTTNRISWTPFHCPTCSHVPPHIYHLSCLPIFCSVSQRFPFCFLFSVSVSLLIFLQTIVAVFWLSQKLALPPKRQTTLHPLAPHLACNLWRCHSAIKIAKLLNCKSSLNLPQRHKRPTVSPLYAAAVVVVAAHCLWRCCICFSHTLQAFMFFFHI